MSPGDKLEAGIKFGPYDTILNDGQCDIQLCSGAEVVYTNDCEGEHTSSEPQLKNCATWETLEDTCGIPTIISNSDKNISVKGQTYFIKNVTIGAKKGITQWTGVAKGD